MSRRPEKNAFSADGLRYSARQAGSPLGGANSCTIKSCFYCGHHKQVDEGRSIKVLGKSTFVCFGCKPEKPGLPA
ncbi:MAG: hypothetical protein K0Q43_204 [Ramlibacter sp.]|jgi:hypothetical protein|nr:hypothetical protein [Ramlibacter sp.]